MVAKQIDRALSPGAVAVVIASAGRPTLLGEVLNDIGAQDLADVTIVVSVPDAASLPPGGIPDGCILVHAKGLAAQRNAGLEAVPNAEYVFCFDDDAVVRTDYLSQGVAFFDCHPSVVALTGRVLADGATGTEISRSEAEDLLTKSGTSPSSGDWRPSRELYGCNLAFRPLALNGQRFDGRLPLYSWLEDHDFARRAMRHGDLARVDDCVIVHRGVKSGGRMAHERLGYSQVMNPAYLCRVGSFPLWLALHESVFRAGKNMLFSCVGAQKSWRRRRARGNLLALTDIARLRFTPERASTISDET